MAKNAVASHSIGNLRFSYPSNWSCAPEESEEGVTLSLQSPGVSFALVASYSSELEPDDLIDQALETLREEHPGLEEEETYDPAWHESSLMEVAFISLDTVSYCWMRSWRVGESTLFVMLQSIEKEAKTARLVFQAICKSFEPDTE